MVVLVGVQEEEVVVEVEVEVLVEDQAMGVGLV